METIILAGGKGERLLPITNHTPKPLIKVGGLTLIQRIIDQIPNERSEILIVIRHLGEEIINVLGNEQKGKKITYVKQDENMLGTMGALYACKDHIKTDKSLLVISSDNIYADYDIKNLSTVPNSILIYKAQIEEILNTPLSKYGNSVLSNGLSKIDHKSKYINTGAYNFSSEIFSIKPELLPGSSEYSLPHTLLKLLNQKKYNFLFTDYWWSVGNHEELDYVTKIFNE